MDSTSDINHALQLSSILKVHIHGISILISDKGQKKLLPYHINQYLIKEVVNELGNVFEKYSISRKDDEDKVEKIMAKLNSDELKTFLPSFSLEKGSPTGREQQIQSHFTGNSSNTSVTKNQNVDPVIQQLQLNQQISPKQPTVISSARTSLYSHQPQLSADHHHPQSIHHNHPLLNSEYNAHQKKIQNNLPQDYNFHPQLIQEHHPQLNHNNQPKLNSESHLKFHSDHTLSNRNVQITISNETVQNKNAQLISNEISKTRPQDHNLHHNYSEGKQRCDMNYSVRVENPHDLSRRNEEYVMSYENVLPLPYGVDMSQSRNRK